MIRRRVISITRCANRFAGYCCAGFLILFGILAKISGVFLAIPASVLGGVTTFLFARFVVLHPLLLTLRDEDSHPILTFSVAVSGLKVISMCSFSRRDRMILAAGLSLGLGNLLVEGEPSQLP